MVSLFLSTTEKSSNFFGGLSCLFPRLCLPVVLVFANRKSTMSSSFDKIRRKNGSFYAGDILLDLFETIRVVGEAEGVRDGL